MKHLCAALLILLLALATLEAEEAGGSLEAADAGQTELPRLLIHQNTFDPLKFQFVDGAIVPPKQLTALLNIPENGQSLRRAKNYIIATRILNALAYVSAAGIVIYAGFDDLPYADTMLSVSICAGLGSAVAGLFTGQGAAVNYLRAVDNYNLYILGIPIGK
jgi:hypothetical protein